ncbi:DUF3857 domain-containing protein [Mucilaginibacter sp. UR6-1]|uniref:DUF3857 domain-containing protein n=1 Tax=Mucilaginibacter sp. UR6-1 TaxID=1435643 RepID=UPI001E546C56|nr:DUF3857 domain-containing protein [Mucilaginibacter sp. UR6-1]MCC8408440.1 DUF3857 domain-containing protein [Mucilaginibacter sp. UR6-1]
MKKLILSLITGALCLNASAQKAVTPAATYLRAFGKIDVTDLELKSCEFEPDANAEVLFDKADVYFDNDFNIITERHKRIKIFNVNGKKNADIRIEYYGGNRLEYLTDLQAQTINLESGKPEITKIDKKQVFTEKVDKIRTALVFSFPNVKPGSVVEFKYRLTANSIIDFPDWYFQSKIPVRYSQLTTKVPEYFYYKPQLRSARMFTVNNSTTESGMLGTGSQSLGYTINVDVRGMANVHSLTDEPMMRSDIDNLQSIVFTLNTVRPIGGFVKTAADTWPKIGGVLADDEDFGKQLKRKLVGEEAIISKAKQFATDDERICYVFNEVKKAMKWNNVDRWFTTDGTVKAWEKKTGNSAEVNLILFHLLKQSGVKAYPMVVSTRDNGRVNPFSPNLHQFNRAVVYIPVDTTRHYVLDATNKYNLYNHVPDNLLNSSGLFIDKESDMYDVVFLQNLEPVRQSYYVNVEIKPDGKMVGTNQVSSYGYNKISRTAKYKTDGETKFIEYLKNKDNNLRISSIKFENMDVDTLPLVQNIAFDLDLTGSDGNFIYFNPNVLTMMGANPFISENRYTDIDFGYRDNTTFTGMYKIPAGYKAETLPKSVSLTLPDNGMVFKRIVNATNEMISVRFVIDHVKTTYFKEDYADFREFSRQMYEMMNEQIVLKKS